MNKQAFTIKPIPVKANDVIIHEFLPSHPSMLAIVAPRKSGKTTLLVNLITRPEMFKGFFHIIHIWSPTILMDIKWKKVTDRLPPEWVHMKFDEQEFSNIMTEISEINDNETKKKQNVLFIFDDSAAEKGLFTRNFQSPTVQAAFTSRHYNVSIWLVSQYYKAISTSFRNNIFHWVLFDTPNEKERDRMSEELSGPLSSTAFAKLLEDVTSMPYAFLYINFEAPNRNHIFRNGFGPPLDISKYLLLKKRKESSSDELSIRSEKKANFITGP